MSELPRTPAEQILLEAKSKYKHQEELITIPEYDESLKVYVQTYSPASRPPKKVAYREKLHVVIVHGLGDYGGRQADKAKYFLDLGYTVTLFDFLGHGKSTGVKGLVNSEEELVDTLDAVIKRCLESHPLVILVGESMGGFASLLHELVMPCDQVVGLALVAPLIRPHADSMPSETVKSLASFVASFWPSMPAAPAHKGNIHSDPAVEEEFEQDPGTYSGWLRAGTGETILKGLETIKEFADSFTKPCVVIHGDKDRTTDVEGSKWFAEAVAKNRNVETNDILTIIEGGEHALYHDHMDEVLEKVGAFCDDACKGPEGL